MRGHKRESHHRRLRIEALEDRQMLAVLTVNSPLDNVVSGDSQVTLREAILAANTDTSTDLGDTGEGPDTIQFDPAVFATPQMIQLSQGELEITDTLTIEGPGRTLLTIDAQLQSRIFNITATTGEFSISGLTLTRGKTAGDGGAIRTLAKLTLEESSINGNSAAGHGGGIASSYDSDHLTVTNSTISGNIAITGGGGGILASSLMLIGSTVSNNSITNSPSDPFGPSGSGIYGDSATLIDSTVSGNAGVGHSINTGGSALTLTNSIVSDNGSGAIYAGVLTLTDTTVSNNGSGGIRGYSVALTGSTVIGDEVRGEYVDLTDSDITDAGIDGGDVALTDSNVTGGQIIAGEFVGGLVTLINSVISGGGISGRVVTLTDSASDSVAVHGAIVDEHNGIPVREGSATLTRSMTQRIHVIDGNVSLVNSTISGGGIYTSSFYHGFGNVSLTHSTISGSGGVGIHKEGISNSVVTLVNSVISGNGGGGISAYRSAVSLDSSTISGNGGRGIYLYHWDFPTDVMLTNSSVHANSGNGIFIRNGAVTLHSSTVSANSAVEGDDTNGGGIYAPRVTLKNSTVSGNSAIGNGGGIHAGNVMLDSSTVSGNTSGASGAGIFSDSGSVTVTYSTVTDNQATNGYGAGISNAFGDITIVNSIIADNTAGLGNPDLGEDAETLVVNNSLIGDNTGTPLVEAQSPDANGNLIGSAMGAGIIDPRLGPLAFNGGPTKTHALLPDSPAIDAIPYTPYVPPAATHEYQLNGSLSDASGGPALVGLGGTFTSTGYEFGPNQGLNLAAPDINPAEYSLELVFSWNALSGGWLKIIDFHDLQSDVGLYTLGNGLQFMNGAFAANLFAANSPRHLVLTRDDATDTLRAYIGGVQVWSFIDTAEGAVFAGPDQIIRFFQDDNASGQTEAQSGFIDRIRIYDRALDATEIMNLFSPPPLSPDVPLNDQRGAPFTRVYNGAIDIGAFELQPIAATFGDYNQDGVVDAADYTVWRDALGQTGLTPFSLGDGDGDGEVTDADYEIWTSHFGELLVNTTPESASAQTATLNQSTMGAEIVSVAFGDEQPESRTRVVDAAISQLPGLVPLRTSATVPGFIGEYPTDSHAAPELSNSTVRQSLLLTLAQSREQSIERDDAGSIDIVPEEDPWDEVFTFFSETSHLTSVFDS